MLRGAPSFQFRTWSKIVLLLLFRLPFFCLFYFCSAYLFCTPSRLLQNVHLKWLIRRKGRKKSVRQGDTENLEELIGSQVVTVVMQSSACLF